MSEHQTAPNGVKLLCNDPDCAGGIHECHTCEGDGWVLDDCFEDSCCCADPESEHDVLECRVCQGKGGWDCPATATEETPCGVLGSAFMETLERRAGAWFDCAECCGDGWKYFADDGEIECHVCHGKGGRNVMRDLAGERKSA